MRIKSIILLVLLSVIVSAVPQKISFQGVLKDSTGSPINGTRNMTFVIYDAATGGSDLWSETQTSVSIEAGIYNVQLGKNTALSSSYFTGDTRYLGISINGGSELTPRVMMLTVPFAYRADTADSAAHATYADTAGSAGGGINFVRLGPSSQQVTDESNAVWVSGDIFGVSAEGSTYGVYGTAHYGVYGLGSGKSPNYGVYGTNADGSAFGYIGSTGVGVKGIGDYGVVGADIDTDKGLHGLSGTCGVIGVAETGIYGSGDVGVYGIGALMGASFEATNSTGYSGFFNGGRGVKITTSSATPDADTATGTIYYNTTDDHVYVKIPSGWKVLDN
jgi:hypothetical protein